MANDRQTKVAEQIALYAAQFVQKEANADPLITITRVETTRDYSQATVFFTTIPEDRQDDAAVFLKRSGADMRQYIKKHMRIKQIPFLDFSVDYGERHRQYIDDLVRDTNTEATPYDPDQDQ